MPHLEDRVRAWSYRRQRLGRGAVDVPSALGEVIAVYASQPTAILGLAARVAGLRVEDYRSVDTDRSAVRLPAMRSSGHLVPTASVDRIVAATRRPGEQLAWMWRGIGLTAAEYAAATRAIVAAADEPFTVARLRTRLAPETVALLDRHPQAATLLVRALRSEGRLVALAPDSLRSNAFAYVSTVAWLGAPLASIDPDEALAWLAGEYLRAFGPARVDDFRWWAGTTAERARAALAQQSTVELTGGLLLRTEDLDPFEHAEPLDRAAVDLIPLWDMYTMGYASDGRARIVDPEHRERAYDGSGNGLGLVLVGGRAVAAWGLRFAGGQMEVDLDAFERLGSGLRRAIEARLGEAGTLLGAANLAIVEGPLRGPGGPR